MMKLTTPFKILVYQKNGKKALHARKGKCYAVSILRPKPSESLTGAAAAANGKNGAEVGKVALHGALRGGEAACVEKFAEVLHVDVFWFARNVFQNFEHARQGHIGRR